MINRIHKLADRMHRYKKFIKPLMYLKVVTSIMFITIYTASAATPELSNIKWELEECSTFENRAERDECYAVIIAGDPIIAECAKQTNVDQDKCYSDTREKDEKQQQEYGMAINKCLDSNKSEEYQDKCMKNAAKKHESALKRICATGYNSFEDIRRCEQDFQFPRCEYLEGADHSKCIYAQNNLTQWKNYNKQFTKCANKNTSEKQTQCEKNIENKFSEYFIGQCYAVEETNAGSARCALKVQFPICAIDGERPTKRVEDEEVEQTFNECIYVQQNQKEFDKYNKEDKKCEDKNDDKKQQCRDDAAIKYSGILTDLKLLGCEEKENREICEEDIIYPECSAMEGDDREICLGNVKAPGGGVMIPSEYRPELVPSTFSEKYTDPETGRQAFGVRAIQFIIGDFAAVILSLTGIAAVYLLAINAVSLVTAYGNDEKITKAKKGITWTIGGFAVILLSYSIVRTIIRILLSLNQS